MAMDTQNGTRQKMLIVILLRTVTWSIITAIQVINSFLGVSDSTVKRIFLVNRKRNQGEQQKRNQESLMV